MSLPLGSISLSCKEKFMSLGINTIIVSGNDQWNLIGGYIPPSETNGETLAKIHDASTCNNHQLILVGDLNTD